MLKQVLHRIISTWIVIVLLLPLGLQFAHSFEHHTYTDCTNKNIEHLHEQQINCEFNHIIFKTNSPEHSQFIEFKESKQFLSTPNYFVAPCNEIRLFSKSSRAPPSVIC